MSRKFASLFAAVVILASAAPASAEAFSRTLSLPVSYADLDLSTTTDAKKLKRRLNNAIERVCGNAFETASMSIRGKIKACSKASMDAAVISVNAPLLTALHEGNEGTQVAQR